MRDIANRNCTTTLRGIAILTIIIGHVGVSGFDCRLFNPLGGIGVSMFLFLSGYGLTESFKKNGLNRFWTKKITRIALPYIIWIPIYHFATRLSPLGLTTYLEPLPRYWFIEYLLIAYTIFYFTFKLCYKHAIIIITAIGVLSFLSLNNLRAEQSFSFLAGIVFSQKKLYFEVFNHKQIMNFAVIFLVIGITALIIKQSPQIRIYDLESIQFKFLNLLIKLPIGISLIFLFFSITPNGIKLLIPVGNISYELYLSHVSFFMSIAGRTLYLVLFFVQTIILAYIIHLLNLLLKKTSNG